MATAKITTESTGPLTAEGRGDVEATDPNATEKIPVDTKPTEETGEFESKSRLKRKTEKGQALYEETVDNYLRKSDVILATIEDVTMKLEEFRANGDFKSLRILDQELRELKMKHIHISEEFMAYLERANTEDSITELNLQETLFDKCQRIMKELGRRIREARIEATEQISHSSFLTLSEVGEPSIAGSTRTKKKIEIETQRAHENINQEDQGYSPEPSILREPINRRRLTADYIRQNFKEDEDQENINPIPQSLNQNFTETRTVEKPVLKELSNQNAKTPENPSVVSDLTRFLLKKDLLFSRFSHFTDKPEAFATWKTSFKSITDELQVTPFEEMDLLVKFLGPESSKFAASIRTANTANPKRGLERIWSRLQERYGSPELVESALKAKLRDFPRITNRENKRLYDLVDILREIEAIKENLNYSALLSYFDSSSGINPIINKLPYSIQEKWTTRASSYKTKKDVPYPPFSYFVEFLQEMSKIRNDPGFQYEVSPSTPVPNQNRKTRSTTVLSCKTEVEPNRNSNFREQKCPIHNTYHSLKDCKTFHFMSLPERKTILRNSGLCFRCLDWNHLARDCKTVVKCEYCESNNHHTLLHDDRLRRSDQCRERTYQKTSDVHNKCTVVCGMNFKGKSCSKTILVNVYPTDNPSDKKTMYAIIDDQSSRTLARSDFFNMFDVPTDSVTYTLSSCGGSVTLSGRCASNFTVEPISEGSPVYLRSVIECDEIPNYREEIPTPNIARAYSHLVDIENQLPELDEKAEILLLIGRDHPDAHHVLIQKTGPSGTPFAQKLSLGWTIIGECCLDKTHIPQVVTNKTHILPSGRSSTFLPCPAYMKVSEVRNNSYDTSDDEITTTDIFVRTPDDEQPSLSVNDREFLKIMDNECYRDEDGCWTAPLPFKSDRQRLPNNREQVFKRTLSFLASCKKNPLKLEHSISFMDKVFSKGHAEIAPELKEEEESWYLPIFGVYNPKKPNQIRMVFDSSATFQGQSLNSILLSGPDLTNSLHGILLRFRRERIGVTGDIEQMFHSFKIREDHRNFVRFIWFRNNDPTQPLTEYRMCVHLFGNSPSPAVATYCLRRCVQENSDCDSKVYEFVNRNFYVDDGLASCDTEGEALEILLKTQTILKDEGNLKFHKFASNSPQVMDELPVEDRAKDLSDLNLDFQQLPLQRSLGLAWNLKSDTFVFHMVPKVRDFLPTKRDILSCLNSLYDPLGFIAPVILQGRFIFREVVNLPIGWDDTVPLKIANSWRNWCNSLHHLSDIQISRTIVPTTLKETDRTEIHVFSDASEKGVCAVAYLRVISKNGQTYLGLIMGKSKLSPQHSNTIPRLELCAALLSTEIASFVLKHIDVTIHEVKFYTDSRIVLGYIHNRTRRFHTYVANRVHRILQHSRPEQWNYISSEENPADVGSRGALASELMQSLWFQGPTHLQTCETEKEDYPLVDPENDQEIRNVNIVTSKTCVENLEIYEKMENFSTWTSLVRAFTLLRKSHEETKTSSLR